MIENKTIDPLTIDWKRINMRNVDHLLGVEFIHDLYNRHEPKINSVRFRHTKTIWKDGILNSYAPQNEWDRLGEVVSQQYYTLNPVIIEHTENLYKRKREHFHKFIDNLKTTDLTSISNEELASVLVNFQSLVLGELYVLNFVQIEHGLNTAVKRVITEIASSSENAEDIFINLIDTEKVTASHEEKQDLYRIVKRLKFLKKIGLYTEAKAQTKVKEHYEKYKYLYSAYGEKPRNYDEFWKSFIDYFSQNKTSITTKSSAAILSPKSKDFLKKFNNPKLNILIPLLVEGGFFRDTNKALLGQSMRYRFGILDEIANRKIETRENLNYYLLSEIVDLLWKAQKVSPSEIQNRQNHGVILTRNEDFKIYTENTDTLDKSQAQQTVIRGQCASKGEAIGECKIVLSKDDVEKVNPGDIMIAIGTDFDLIEAMYRSSAVITEEGGILSHASVVCRELSKPCCIAVKNATHIFKDGQKVKVNATKGEITIL